jgi:hypothetical protein
VQKSNAVFALKINGGALPKEDTFSRKREMQQDVKKIWAVNLIVSE